MADSKPITKSDQNTPDGINVTPGPPDPTTGYQNALNNLGSIQVCIIIHLIIRKDRCF